MREAIMESIANYIYVKNINLNLNKMKHSCDLMYDYIKNNISSEPGRDYSGQSTMTTKLYSQYNVLLYPYDEFYELYEEIKKAFHEVCQDKKSKFYIQCWLNCYRKDEYISWHGHWPSHCKAWHGFYCVEVEPSVTTYRLPPGTEVIDVNDKNNTIVLSKSDNDQHRTWPWPYEDRMRITIAFDIVPREHIDPIGWKNHWIPI